MSIQNEQAEVSAERGEQYGDFADVATRAQHAKKLLLSSDMSPVQSEAMEMICHKLARLASGNPAHRDSWFDIAGYAMLVVKEIDRAATQPMHVPV